MSRLYVIAARKAKKEQSQKKEGNKDNKVCESVPLGIIKGAE